MNITARENVRAFAVIRNQQHIAYGSGGQQSYNRGWLKSPAVASFTENTRQFILCQEESPEQSVQSQGRATCGKTWFRTQAKEKMQLKETRPYLYTWEGHKTLSRNPHYGWTKMMKFLSCLLGISSRGLRNLLTQLCSWAGFQQCILYRTHHVSFR